MNLFRRILSIALLCLLLGGCASQQGRINGVDLRKTIEALDAANGMTAFVVEPAHEELLRSGKWDEYIAHSTRRAKSLRLAAFKINQIDLRDVDPQAAVYIINGAEVFGLMAECNDRNAEIALASKEYLASFRSPAAYWEAVVRGLKGDPLGKVKEAVAANFKGQQLVSDAQVKDEILNKRVAELSVQFDALREHLLRHYGIRY